MLIHQVALRVSITMPISKSNKFTQLLPRYLHKAPRFVQVFAEQTVFDNPPHNKGSSALIVIYKSDLSRFMMQRIANHTHHSATVFLKETEIKSPSCSIRWFNQHNEIKRCGHGTLAAALYLKKYQGNSPRQFYSLTGEIFKIQSSINNLQLEITAINSEKIAPVHAIEMAIKTPILQSYATTSKHGYTTVLINTEHPLKELDVRVTELTDYPNAVIVLQQNPHNGCFSFRYFAPYYGIAEDQATGSALSVLAPLIKQLNTEYKGALFQASINGAVINYQLKNQCVRLY